MLIDLLVDVAALIETTITVDKVAVTPGEPAQTDSCSAAYVWGSTIASSREAVDFAGNDQGCIYRRAYQIDYRIDICHKVKADGKELSTAEQLAEATELYGYADAVWCALTAAAAGGTLFDAPNTTQCEAVTVGELIIDGPTGDRVSATGSLRVTHPCQEGS